jgi:hypothetical protein
MLEKSKLDQLAEVVGELNITPRDFTGDDTPDLGQHVEKIPYFFAFTALQMCGTGRKVDGEVGCSRIWNRFYEKWCDDHRFFDPVTAANLSHAEMGQVLDFSDRGLWISDKDLYWRWQLHRGLGRHILKIAGFSFANTRIAHLEGYNYDPLEKKANLLRMILACRPERFVNDHQYGPVVDYHVMRLLIRTGVIPLQEDTQTKNMALREREIRESAFSAMVHLQMKTDKSYNQLDTLFWSTGRQVCRPHKIRCDHCPFARICSNKSAIEIRIDTINY